MPQCLQVIQDIKLQRLWCCAGMDDARHDHLIGRFKYSALAFTVFIDGIKYRQRITIVASITGEYARQIIHRCVCVEVAGGCVHATRVAFGFTAQGIRTGRIFRGRSSGTAQFPHGPIATLGFESPAVRIFPALARSIDIRISECLNDFLFKVQFNGIISVLIHSARGFQYHPKFRYARSKVSTHRCR